MKRIIWCVLVMSCSVMPMERETRPVRKSAFRAVHTDSKRVDESREELRRRLYQKNHAYDGLSALATAAEQQRQEQRPLAVYAHPRPITTAEYVGMQKEIAALRYQLAVLACEVESLKKNSSHGS